jgi:hypothetical protein
MSKAPARKREGDISIDEIPEASTVLSSELPDEVIGTVTNAEYTTDRFGRQIIKFRVLLDDGRETVFTYPPSTFNTFKSFAKKLNIAKLSDFIGRAYKFKRMGINSTRFNTRPRHFPIEDVTVSSEEVTKRQKQPMEKPVSKPSAKPARKQQVENEEQGEEEEYTEE